MIMRDRAGIENVYSDIEALAASIAARRRNSM